MKFFPFILLMIFVNISYAQNNLPQNGNVGIGTLNPQSLLTLRSGNSGMSIHPGTAPYYGTLAFNRESATGAIFDPTGYAYQINNGGGDHNLHIQVYDGSGNFVTANALTINTSGNVGVGIASADQKLSVAGTIHAQAVKVDMTGWGDYVFNKNYNLKELDSVKNYINIHHHLPGIPAANVIKKNGADLGELVKLQMKKIEELTLYLIQKDEQLSQQKIKSKKLENDVELLKKQVATLIKASSK